MNVTTSSEKETMSFSGIKETYMGRFHGRKEKGERKGNNFKKLKNMTVVPQLYSSLKFLYSFII